MPAKISVQFRGIIQGEHLVSDDVIRIGNDANCEVCVPSQTAHVLTLRFDSGRFTVFNRSGRELRLEAQKLAANGSLPWQNGEDLFLDENLVLTLVIDGNPEPVRQRISVATAYTGDLQVDEPDAAADAHVDDQADGATPPSRSNTPLQLAVIVFCVLAFGLLMLVDPNSKSGAAPRDAATVRREFAECVSGIKAEMERNPSVAADLETIRIALQDARIHELRRGQEQKALKLYRKLLQQLSDQYRTTDQGDFRNDPVGNLAKQVYGFSVAQSSELEGYTRVGGG